MSKNSDTQLDPAKEYQRLIFEMAVAGDVDSAGLTDVTEALGLSPADAAKDRATITRYIGLVDTIAASEKTIADAAAFEAEHEELLRRHKENVKRKNAAAAASFALAMARGELHRLRNENARLFAVGE